MKEVKKIKPTGLFTNYIYKSIPLAFDESMSYYETLCGLLYYLKNTVIPAVDNNADALIEVQNLMTQLQQYVNNYFNNLDVQEEINNKLDEMVEDGTLDQIIEQYLNSSAIWGFDTVNDMKNASNLINGSYARTLGYHSKNDGGSALYKIRTITNDDVVNNMNILSLNNSNTLIAELVILPNEKINIKQLGVYGDNSHNDTTIINNVLSLYDNLYFPKGAYLINDTIVIDSNKKIKIDGNIVFSGTKNKPAILIKNKYNDIELTDIVDSASYNNGNYSSVWHGWENSDYAGIELEDVSYSSIKFNKIHNFTSGVKINGATSKGTFKTFINGSWITDCKYGLFFTNTNPSWINNCKINNIMINYGSSGDFYTHANPVTTYGIYQENNSNDTYGMKFMEFNNLFFETTAKDNFIGFNFNLIGRSQFNMCIPEIKVGTIYAKFEMKYTSDNVINPNQQHSYENIFYDCRPMGVGNNNIVFANTGKIACSLPQIAKHNNTEFNTIFEDTCLVGKAGLVTNNKTNVRGYGVTFLTSSTLTLSDYQLIRTNGNTAITNDFTNHYLNVPASFPLSIMLKVSVNETYRIKIGPSGNSALKLFNNNGELIDGIVDSVKKLGGYFTYNSTHKNMSAISGNLNDYEFTILDSSVAYVLIMIYNQVNNIKIEKYEASGNVIKLAPYLAHVEQLGDVNCSDTKPTTDATTGAYTGQTFYKSTLANLGEKWTFDGTNWN